jgi:hypothetical protein
VKVWSLEDKAAEKDCCVEVLEGDLVKRRQEWIEEP